MVPADDFVAEYDAGNGRERKLSEERSEFSGGETDKFGLVKDKIIVRSDSKFRATRAVPCDEIPNRFDQPIPSRVTAALSSTVGVSWNYDSFGDRLRQTALKGYVPENLLSFSGGNNRADQVCYDAAGNVLSNVPCQDMTMPEYSYDAEGKMASSGFGAVHYLYDADGNRVAKQSGNAYSNVYFYDVAGHMAVETDGGLNVLREELYAGNRHIATRRNGQILYAHTNWLGTESARSDSNGNLCETIAALPYGDGLQVSGNCDPSNKIFTGKERDSESGLDYFGARYYGSNTGRFMSPDPSGLALAAPANPQTLNLYSYSLNNPLRLADPTGLTPCDYGPSDQGGNDYEDADNDKECTDNGGTPIDASETVNVNSNNSGDDWLSTVTADSSSLVQYQTFDGAPSSLLGKLCGAVPSGTVVSISGNGNFVGTAGSLDLVTNGRTGEVTGFFSPGYFAGAATAGGSLTGGYTFGNLGAGNSNFAGGFTGVSAGYGIFAGSAATSSGGPGSPLSGISPRSPGHVTTVSAGVQTPGRALSVNSTFSLPTQLGKLWTLADPATALVYLANQACKAAGH